MTDSQVKTAAIDPARLAAWESSTVQTLDPLLSKTGSDALWSAIVKNRSAPNALTFGINLTEILRDETQSARAYDLMRATSSVLVGLSSLVTPIAAAAAKE